MDFYATFPSPVKAVFGHLADPSRLGDWLPEISAADPRPSDGTGAEFLFGVGLEVAGPQVPLGAEEAAVHPQRSIMGSRPSSVQSRRVQTRDVSKVSTDS